MIKRVHFNTITVKENGRSKSYMNFEREGIQLRLPFSFHSCHLNIYMLMMLGDEPAIATYIKEHSDGHHAE